VGSSPKVLVVSTSNRRRGAEVFAEDLFNGLPEHGWAVDAVSLTDGRSEAQVALDPLTTIPPNELGRMRIAVVRSLRRRLRNRVPDIVLANGGPTLRYAVLATRGLGLPLVYRAIGEPLYWVRDTLAVTLNRALLRRTDAIFAVSNSTREQLLRMEGSLTGRVSVMYRGVGERFFEVEHTDHGGVLRILMVGNLSPEKDPATAVGALPLVPDATLRLVGDGPLKESLRSEAQRLGVADRLEIVGPTDDVMPHLAWADVLLLTSLTEGLPGVLLEAGAAGLPSVATDVGGVREVIVDQLTGLIAERDVQALAASVRELEDPTRRSGMGREARRHVAERFRLADSVKRHSEALRGILENGTSDNS
jgi:glycosyltransferase involved in cell wall biosynthesis